MKDSRVTVWTNPTTINSNTTTNGPTIDLLENVVLRPTNQIPIPMGLGVHILITSISGTSFELRPHWEVSSDGSTWQDAGDMVDPSDLLDPPVDVVGSKILIKSRLRTRFRYARIAIVSTNISSESCVVDAYAEDGVPSESYNEIFYA